MEYDPMNKDNLMTDNDLKKTIHLIEDFKKRHQTITESIGETYKIGNRLLTYLQKQIIIDYHLRGEQDILEKEHPNLADIAKKWLGHEFYYDLSVATAHGEPLFITHYDHFQTLMKKQDEIKQLIIGHYKEHLDQRVEKLHLP